jgi:formylglycine-generating enzyme required for sulfatase activity
LKIFLAGNNMKKTILLLTLSILALYTTSASAGNKYILQTKDTKIMRLITGGYFIMGSHSKPEESPPHRVYVKSFYLDATEVTFKEFENFVKKSGYVPKGNYKSGYKPGLEKHPVVNVTHSDAQSYAKWANKRLPTESEWEYACGGPRRYVYDFGNAWNRKGAALWDSKRKTSVKVASYRPNGYGLYDMSGNVLEWTSSKYLPYPRGKKNPNMNGDFMVAKGGCFMFFADRSRRQARHAVKPDFSFVALGFRCAKNIN